MARENVELLRRFFELWGKGDMEAAQRLVEASLGPDFEFVPYVSQVEGKTYRGRNALASWLEDMLEAFEEVRPQVTKLREMGDHVVVSGRTLLRSKTSGAESDFDWVQVFEFREGRAVRCQIFRHEEEARNAVELRTKTSEPRY